MLRYVYDGSFLGFLTCVFESYRLRSDPEEITAEKRLEQILFAEDVAVQTDEEKADRVFQGLLKISPVVPHDVYYAYLTEIKGIERHILQFIRKTIEAKKSIAGNVSDEDIRLTMKAAQGAGGESHMFKGLLRFTELADGTLYGPFEPDYNVVPLLSSHFKHRLRGKIWLIHDTRRNCAAYFDGNDIAFYENIEAPIQDAVQGKETVVADNENTVRELWRGYFHSIAIKERLNPALQRSIMPKKYWKYLTEKL